MHLMVGDHVVMKKSFEGNGEGCSGIIEILEQRLEGGHQIGVFFDSDQPWARESRRWWVFCSEIEIDEYFDKISSPPDDKKRILLYQPGMPIDDYVDLLQKKVTHKEQLKWLKTFQNCILPQEVKEVIEEALAVVLNKKKFDEWGVNDHFEKGLTNSILVYGPPGTGKTMICESIAAILGKNLMKIDTGMLQSQIPGQMERNIKKSFEEAKKKNCVVLFDECDSLLSSRELVGVIQGSEINALLTEIERFQGVIVLTTNRINRLDAALARRIIAKIKLDLPNKETRKAIWQKLLPPNVPIDDNIDWDILAQTEIAGGDIKNAILLAIRKTIAKNQDKVTMDHFMAGLRLASETKFMDRQAIIDKQMMTPRDISFANKTKSEGDHASWKL